MDIVPDFESVGCYQITNWEMSSAWSYEKRDTFPVFKWRSCGAVEVELIETMDKIDTFSSQFLPFVESMYAVILDGHSSPQLKIPLIVCPNRD